MMMSKVLYRVNQDQINGTHLYCKGRADAMLRIYYSLFPTNYSCIPLISSADPTKCTNAPIYPIHPQLSSLKPL